MKNHQIFSSDEDDHYTDSPGFGSCCWWRPDPNSTDSAKPSVLGPGSASGRLEPRVRVVRELERLAAAARDLSGLGELRHKVVTYRCGDFWMPTGGIPKEKIEIPSVSTVLLVGLCGSGKSSLVNLMYSVLGRSGLVPFAQTSSGNNSNYTSMYMEEHNVIRSLRSGFCVYDSRGFDADQSRDSLDELSSWMSDGVHHNQLCLRSEDYSLPKHEVDALMSRPSSKFMTRRVNCAVFVVDLADVSQAFKAEDYMRLNAIKDLYCSHVFKKLSEKPILVLTHGDLLSADERIEGRIKICEWLNISETSGVYDIVCLTEYGFVAEESDPVSAYALAETVYRALLVSDRTHPPKRNWVDWISLPMSWLMCFIATFFAFLAHVFAKFGPKDGRLRL